jgi:hypothetical protein
MYLLYSYIYAYIYIYITGVTICPESVIKKKEVTWTKRTKKTTEVTCISEDDIKQLENSGRKDMLTYAFTKFSRLITEGNNMYTVRRDRNIHPKDEKIFQSITLHADYKRTFKQGWADKKTVKRLHGSYGDNFETDEFKDLVSKYHKKGEDNPKEKKRSDDVLLELEGLYPNRFDLITLAGINNKYASLNAASAASKKEAAAKEAAALLKKKTVRPDCISEELELILKGILIAVPNSTPAIMWKNFRKGVKVAFTNKTEDEVTAIEDKNAHLFVTTGDSFADIKFWFSKLKRDSKTELRREASLVATAEAETEILNRDK